MHTAAAEKSCNRIGKTEMSPPFDVSLKNRPAYCRPAFLTVFAPVRQMQYNGTILFG